MGRRTAMTTEDVRDKERALRKAEREYREAVSACDGTRAMLEMRVRETYAGKFVDTEGGRRDRPMRETDIEAMTAEEIVEELKALKARRAELRRRLRALRGTYETTGEKTARWFSETYIEPVAAMEGRFFLTTLETGRPGEEAWIIEKVGTMENRSEMEARLDAIAEAIDRSVYGEETARFYVQRMMKDKLAVCEGTTGSFVSARGEVSAKVTPHVWMRTDGDYGTMTEITEEEFDGRLSAVRETMRQLGLKEGGTERGEVAPQGRQARLYVRGA